MPTRDASRPAGPPVRGPAAFVPLLLRNHAVRFLTGFVTLLGGAVAICAVLFLADLHRSAIEDTERSLTGLSTMLADQADHALQAIELVQDAILEEIQAAEVADPAQYAQFAARQALHDRLKARISALPQVNAITMIDHTGKLLNFSRYWPIPDINISDRDYFKALAADPDLKRFIGRPVPNRGDGVWTIYIARKVTAPDGSFLGLILGAVELGYFEHLYTQVSPAEDAVITLFGNDGLLFVRHPRRADTVGRTFAAAAAMLIAAKDPSGGVVRTVSPIDGRDRLVAARALTSYPMILSVSRTSEASLAQWRRQTTAAAIAILAFELALAGLLALGLRHTRSQALLSRSDAARAAAEERERGERHLRDQYARFGIALDNMTQGLCLFDGADVLIVMNSRFMGMHGVPPALARPGTPLQHLLDHLSARQRGIDPDAACPLAAACRRTAREGLPVAATCNLADGRAIAVIHATIPGGGWVCTHEDVTDHHRREAHIAFLARHDTLTGLPNRVPLYEALARALARAGEGAGRDAGGGVGEGAAPIVLCLDLDGFKAVNDTYGHPVGDELLCQAARRFEGVVGGAALVSRMGGDEFAVVPAGPVPAGGAERLAERLIDALRTPFDLQGREITIGTSIGIARAGAEPIEPAAMLRQADAALYQAKAAGRGTWRLFDPAMDAATRRRRQVGADLRTALADGELDLHYQPLVEARTLQVRGFEALLRWCHPEHGPIGPGEFVPIAEETGLIRPLGAWVLAAACAEAATWPEGLMVAVNLSAVQFQAGDLADIVQAALARSGLDPVRLELEITESVLLSNNEATLAMLDRLRTLGVRIAMDDFGTGYASLSYLRRFPFDKIKIDQSFVRSLEHEPDSLAIVRAIVGLGRGLDMAVLAEGVETAGQLAILRREGCDELQGFLLGRPCPRADIPALIARSLAGRFGGAGTDPAPAGAPAARSA